MPRQIIRFVFIPIALAMALASCGGKPDPIWSQFFGFNCAASAGAASGAFCSTRAAGEGAAEVSRYCYQTLADANCLDRPDQDRKNQALGSSGY
jgi:hypothetical protein